MKSIAVSLLLLVAFVGGAVAGQMTITQKGKKFSEKKVELAAGSSIDFVNDDDITHNVYSSSKGHEFDLGAQKPGSTASHVFGASGKVKVRCAIHPKMKMTIVVN
tara:strand:- start:306 stop:620 length:315 start_codon:yes stop_codon:yes gene_type:complete